MFTLHGTVMIFLFLIPGIPAILGNFVLPLMLGAKDVAFPRLNLAELLSLVERGRVLPRRRWPTGRPGHRLDLLHALQHDHPHRASSLAVPGVFILGFSSIFTGLNFIVTIHTLRPPGMTWFRMPLFLWGLYATALIQVLATPVLGITLLLLAVERMLGLGIFDPKLGGDPVLFQHFFWFYSHPAVYIMILPGMGIISELFSVFSRKHIFGYQLHRLQQRGHRPGRLPRLGTPHVRQRPVAAGRHDLQRLTFAVAIPSAIKVFNWLATMYKGSIWLATPMCYALVFLFLFGIGGLTGLFLGALAVNVHVHDTYFVVAHFHYVMVGGTMIAFLGGLHYWWPKITGRMYSEFWGRIGCPADLRRLQPHLLSRSSSWARTACRAAITDYTACWPRPSRSSPPTTCFPRWGPICWPPAWR